jgi:hypothetical protein
VDKSDPRKLLDECVPFFLQIHWAHSHSAHTDTSFSYLYSIIYQPGLDPIFLSWALRDFWLPLPCGDSPIGVSHLSMNWKNFRRINKSPVLPVIDFSHETMGHTWGNCAFVCGGWSLSENIRIHTYASICVGDECGAWEGRRNGHQLQGRHCESSSEGEVVTGNRWACGRPSLSKRCSRAGR